jgi:MarR family transcriptional regulator, lower aerobic nicotinate degradation pathway regulator
VQAVLDAVRRIVHALRESSRWAEKHVGLSGAQLFVLQTLAEATAAVSVNELAALTHTHQSSVSTVVARLVERCLVRRARSDADARIVQLSLAPRGQRLATRAPDVAQQRLIHGVERLSSTRRRQLASTLSELAHAMDAADAAPAMFFEDRGARPGQARHARAREARSRKTRARASGKNAASVAIGLPDDVRQTSAPPSNARPAVEARQNRTSAAADARSAEPRSARGPQARPRKVSPSSSTVRKAPRHA